MNPTTMRWVQNSRVIINVLRLTERSMQWQKAITASCLSWQQGLEKHLLLFRLFIAWWSLVWRRGFFSLADRNILVDQTLINDFRPLATRWPVDQRLLNSPEALNSYEIYLGLYQQLAGEDGTETHYEKFGKDFFDLIVIDEVPPCLLCKGRK